MYKCVTCVTMQAWKAVRSCYKGIVEPKKLEAEMPDTYVGLFLLRTVKQVCGGYGRGVLEDTYVEG